MKELLELTHPQKRIWYTELLMPNTSAANLVGSTYFDEKINIKLLEQAINLVIFHNEALRTHMVLKESNVFQYVRKHKYKQFEVIKDNIQSYINQQSSTPFTLIDSDLYYFAIMVNNNKLGFFYRYHHIICDAISVSIINHQVYTIYQQLINNEKVDLSKPSFKDLIKKEKDYLASPTYLQDEEFWKGEYNNNLSLDYFNINPKNIAYTTSRINFTFSSSLTQKVNNFCDTYKLSLFRFIMGIFYLYFSKTTLQKEIVITTGHHNRKDDYEKTIVGMSVSTVPIKVEIDDQLDFLTFINIVKKKISLCLSHHAYPFDNLSHHLRNYNISPQQLLQITLNHIPSLTSNYQVERYSPLSDPAILNIKINPNQLPNDSLLEIAIDYRLQLFNESEINLLFERIEYMLETILENPTILLKDIDIITVNERNKLLHFNNANYDFTKSIPILFKEQLLRYKDKFAVCTKDKSLTYYELDKKSDELASLLRKSGIKKEKTVAILTNRSLDFVVGALAVLKSGGAYVPIDPTYPLERILYLLNDAKASVLLSKQEIQLDYEITRYNLDDETIYQETNDEIIANNEIHDLAYIIYTSGTTGKPKGVMIEHQQFTNFVLSYKNEFNINSTDNCAAYFNFCFDGSVSEIFPPLISGATLHILTSDIRLDPNKINDYFHQHKISIASFPTKFGELFMATTDNNSLRFLFLGGEKLNYYKKLNYQIVNAYGPTETAVYATYFIVDKEYNNIPLGKPLPNNNVYIALANGALAPTNVEGELWISGLQVGRGYNGLDDLTNERFIIDPFNHKYRLYKTGDIAKRNIDGNFIYLGRRDDQVKIRGYRIELSEIENTIKTYQDVKQAVVIDCNYNNEDKKLYAFIVSDKPISNEEIRLYLDKQLPNYMIPFAYYFLEELPTSNIGKVNKRALRDYINNHNQNNVNNNSFNETELEILKIWKSLLKIDNLSKSDSFFSIGGHSLLAIRLNKKINDYFHTKIPVSFIYTQDTIEKQALLVKQKQLNLERLVKLRDGDLNKLPLFCIHDMLGEILSYRNMTDLIEDNPEIYGIRYSYKINDPLSIEIMANDYIQSIKTIQPTGPYQIIGYSSGGMVAYEMAQKLKANNEQVKLLILIDTPEYGKYPQRIVNFYSNMFKFGIKWFMYLSRVSKIEFTKYVISIWLPAFIKSIFISKQHRLFPTQKKLRDALINYNPNPYQGRMILLKTKHTERFAKNLGWDNIDELTVMPIEGNHITLVNKSNAKIVANIINKILKENM